MKDFAKGFIGALLLASAAPAVAEQAGTLDSLLEAADRGEMAPIARSVSTADRADVKQLLQAHLAAARLDPRPALGPAIARLAKQERDPQLRRSALWLIVSVGFAHGHYAQVAEHGPLLEASLIQAGKPVVAADVGRTWRLARLLATLPQQKLDGAVVQASIPASTDRVGLPRTTVLVNGQPQEAVVDTGAALSVLSAETARRLGVRLLDGQAEVENGVESTVPVRVGVADRLEIAGTRLRNVPFLIIDDAHLTFPLPGGYDIRAILGIPELRRLGAFRMERAGRFTVQPGGAGDAAEPNLHASGNMIFVDTTIDGRTLPMVLDTGANATALSELYAAAHPSTIAALPKAASQRASAGGTATSEIAKWADAPIGLAGRTVRLPTLHVTLGEGGEEERFYGTLGSDLLRRFDSYTLDFRTMRLEVGQPIQTAAR